MGCSLNCLYFLVLDSPIFCISFSIHSGIEFYTNLPLLYKCCSHCITMYTHNSPTLRQFLPGVLNIIRVYIGLFIYPFVIVISYCCVHMYYSSCTPLHKSICNCVRFCTAFEAIRSILWVFPIRFSLLMALFEGSFYHHSLSFTSCSLFSDPYWQVFTFYSSLSTPPSISVSVCSSTYSSLSVWSVSLVFYDLQYEILRVHTSPWVRPPI